MGILIVLLMFMATPAFAQEKAAPVTQEKVAPVAQEKAAPVTQEKAAPVAQEKAAPVTQEKAAPVAQNKAVPAQGQPPKNVTKHADGHYTANMDPSNAEKFEVHVVQQGETLSAIAKASLNNPKLWPLLWESNDHIVNPHWIYPNDKILINRLKPPPMLISETISEIPEPVPPPPFELATNTQQQAPAPVPETQEATAPPPKPIQYPNLILSAPPPPPPPKATFVLNLPDPKPTTEIKRADLYCSGFIRSQEFPDDLKVIGRFGSDPGAMATTADYVYLNLDAQKSIQPGSVYQIIRPTKHIHDPEKSHDLGKHFLEVGQIRVVLLQDEYALARVTYNCEALELGDIAVPFRDVNVPDLPRPRPFSPMMTASGETKGFVVLSKSAVTNFGSAFKGTDKIAGVRSGTLEPVEKGIEAAGGIVYVDVGRPNGVAPGDLFIVFRETPPNEKLYPLPHGVDKLNHSRVAIAEIVILKVEERSSTALVTYSTDAVMSGDMIEKRAPLPRR
jgi:hypothetical protein